MHRHYYHQQLPLLVLLLLLHRRALPAPALVFAAPFAASWRPFSWDQSLWRLLLLLWFLRCAALALLGLRVLSFLCF